MKTQRLAKVRFVALLGLVGIVGLAFPGMAFPDENDASPTITVQIYNYSQASPTVLVGAEREAGRILRRGWLAGSLVGMSGRTVQRYAQRTLRESARSHRPPATSAWRAHPNEFQDTVFGFTIHPAFASVYYEYAVRRAKSDRCRVGDHNNPGWRHRPRTRPSAAWYERPFRRGNYAATVGAQSGPAAHDGQSAFHD